jgi:hypothetical protein
MDDAVLAEFDSADLLARADARLRSLGYRRIHSFSPYPVDVEAPGDLERLDDAAPGSARAPVTRVPRRMLVGGIAGAALGYFVQWWCNARDYPLDVGGRPLHAAPAFVPIAFESAILAASLTGFVALVRIAGLPRLHHPICEIPDFERAAVDRFWLGVERSDPRFDEGVTNELLRLGALRCERLAGAPPAGAGR